MTFESRRFFVRCRRSYVLNNLPVDNSAQNESILKTILHVGSLNKNIIERKRFYTRGTLSRLRISRLAKIPTLYRDWPWSKKRVNHLSYKQGKEVVKTFAIVHKKPRYLLIQYKISFYRTKATNTFAEDVFFYLWLGHFHIL